jgi:hypothetical protein
VSECAIYTHPAKNRSGMAPPKGGGRRGKKREPGTKGSEEPRDGVFVLLDRAEREAIEAALEIPTPEPNSDGGSQTKETPAAARSSSKKLCATGDGGSLLLTKPSEAGEVLRLKFAEQQKSAGVYDTAPMMRG